MKPAGDNQALLLTARPLVRAEPLLLTRPDAARLLSVSPRKLDQWVAAGLIPKWKCDGVMRFTLDDLRAFVAASRPKVITQQAAGGDP
jgi:hypothetical protein